MSYKLGSELMRMEITQRVDTELNMLRNGYAVLSLQYFKRVIASSAFRTATKS